MRWRLFLIDLVCKGVRSALTAGVIAAVLTTTASHTLAFSPADFERHVKALKEKAPDEEFTIVVTPPFVVIGDDPPEEVHRRAKENVAWAVKMLKKAYFTQDPKEILDVWLFKDRESYKEHVATLFRTKSDTPYGYYSHADHALIMNIGTGGGTLIHEIVHPYIAANFPECPTWFNEGLASLYEQCGEENGKICGYTNWRLAGLQEAIRDGELPSFEKLCAMTEKDFYEKDRGANYAQARYLCYYLQEKGQLQAFYRRFHANCATDPTGYKSLQKILERDDMDKFQEEWEAFVLELRFR